MKKKIFALIKFLASSSNHLRPPVSSPAPALRKREAARCRCRVTGCASSLRSSYLSRWGALLPRPLVPALRRREGFGGEKAATSAASLPVPNNLSISLISSKLSRLRQCSASGKPEQKREVVFPLFCGKTTSRFCSDLPLGEHWRRRKSLPETKEMFGLVGTGRDAAQVAAFSPPNPSLLRRAGAEEATRGRGSRAPQRDK